MPTTNRTYSIWLRLADKPAGKWLFSRLVCWTAPYFSSIRPRFVELRPGFSRVRMKKRRAVTNHIGTVHAIAMCNVAEIAAGTMTEVTVPATERWIPKGMTVEYLQKAESNLVATATIDPLPAFGEALTVPVNVDVTDDRGTVVFRAVIDMWVTPKKSAA